MKEVTFVENAILTQDPKIDIRQKAYYAVVKHAVNLVRENNVEGTRKKRLEWLYTYYNKCAAAKVNILSYTQLSRNDKNIRALVSITLTYGEDIPSPPNIHLEEISTGPIIL